MRAGTKSAPRYGLEKLEAGSLGVGLLRRAQHAVPLRKNWRRLPFVGINGPRKATAQIKRKSCSSGERSFFSYGCHPGIDGKSVVVAGG